MEETVMTPNEVDYRDVPNRDVLITILLSFGGFALGYDSVVLTGFYPKLMSKYSVSFQMQSFIVGISTVGAFVACIVAPLLNDRYGRRKTILLSSGISVIGDIMLASAFGKITFIIAHFITGLSIGLTSATVPMYIMECAIPERRGCLTCAFQFAIALGYFVCSIMSVCLFNLDYGFRLVVALNIIPALVFASSAICLPESPRWLALKKRDDEARHTLCRILGSDDGIDKMIDMIHGKADESDSYRSCVLRVLRCPSTRRAVLVGGLVQLMQPLSGIEALAFFLPMILRLGGTQLDHALRIWMVILGVLAFSSLIPFFYVEKVGRKNLFLISLLGVSLSQAVTAAGLWMVASAALTTELVFEPPPDQPKSHCGHYETCFLCLYDKACGFCFEPAPVTLHHQQYLPGYNGSCLPVRSQDAQVSAYGPCEFYPQEKKYQWLVHNCPVDKIGVNVGITGCALFTLFYAMGTGAVPWIYSAETFPTWARSTGVAASVAMRWAMSAVIIISYFHVRFFLPSFGQWLCFAMSCFLGALIFVQLMSESKYREMEQLTEEEQTLQRDIS